MKPDDYGDGNDEEDEDGNNDGCCDSEDLVMFPDPRFGTFKLAWNLTSSEDLALLQSLHSGGVPLQEPPNAAGKQEP